MTTWWLETLQTSNELFLSRIKSLVNIQKINIDITDQIVRRGDICLCTGIDISRWKKNKIATLLQTGANLVVLPPYENGKLFVVPSQLIEIQIQSVEFVPAKIVDAGLRQACGLEEFVILYNQVFTSYPGKQVVVYKDGLPVVVKYQHRSTWGSIVLITLLLGSSSARSKRDHRVALLNSLSRWLSNTNNDYLLNQYSDEIVQDIRLSSNYPLLILVLSCLLPPQSFRTDELISRYKLVQNRLGNQFSQDSWNTGWPDELLKIGLLERYDEAFWQVKNDLLKAEVDRLNLIGYVRRLS